MTRSLTSRAPSGADTVSGASSLASTSSRIAEGRLVPETYVKIVQPAEAGIVRDILVEEGDAVRAGQVLLRVDPAENSVDSAAAQAEHVYK